MMSHYESKKFENIKYREKFENIQMLINNTNFKEIV